MAEHSPYYPDKELSYGSLYFFIKHKTFNINPFDKASIFEAKQVILQEARAVSPSYKLFIKAAIKATNLSERTIKTFLYTDIKKDCNESTEDRDRSITTS